MVYPAWLREFDRYLQYERQYTATTRARYCHDVRQFVHLLQHGVAGALDAQRLPRRFFRHLDDTTFEKLIVEATHASIWNFQNFMRKVGYRPTSCVRKSASLRAFYKFCCKRGYCAEDPTRIAGYGMSTIFAYRTAIEPQIERVLDQPDTDTELGLRDRLILGLCLEVGLSISELVRLELEDVQDGGLHVRAFRRRAARKVCLPEPLREILARYMVFRRRRAYRPGCTQLLLSRYGVGINPRTIRLMVRQRGLAVGLQLNPRKLRCAHIQRLVRAGIGVDGLQQQVGLLQSCRRYFTAYVG